MAARHLNKRLNLPDELQQGGIPRVRQAGHANRFSLRCAYTGVTAESVRGHLARFRDYFDRFNAGQRKELVEAVVQAVTVEGPARARVRFTLPTEPLGRFNRGFEGDPANGSNYGQVWWPQRDANPNGIPAEFVIKL
jgi:hypothetical protein